MDHLAQPGDAISMRLELTVDAMKTSIVQLINQRFTADLDQRVEKAVRTAIGGNELQNAINREIERIVIEKVKWGLSEALRDLNVSSLIGPKVREILQRKVEEIMRE